MEKEKSKIRINELRSMLNDANRRYYVDNAPIFSDYEFDMLMKELEALEKQYPEFADQNSPTRNVGSDISRSRKEFEQFPHRYPMLSLGNTYDIP